MTKREKGARMTSRDRKSRCVVMYRNSDINMVGFMDMGRMGSTLVVGKNLIWHFVLVFSSPTEKHFSIEVIKLVIVWLRTEVLSLLHTRSHFSNRLNLIVVVACLYLLVRHLSSMHHECRINILI